MHPPLSAVRIDHDSAVLGGGFLTRLDIVSTLSRPPCAADGILVTWIEGTEESL